MIREYKLNTASCLDLGYKSVYTWADIFPKLTQADLDNPRLFTPNLESMVEPKKKEQEWEILVISFEDTNHLFIPNGEGRFFHCKHFSENQSGWTQDELLNHKTKEYRIHTVKRLSDGETFSVGDKIDSVTQPHFNNLPIKEFVIIGETLTANVHKFEASHGYKLSDIKKSQQPPQEEQKDNYVFVWDDAKVKDAVELAWLTGVTKNGIAPKKFIDDFKASKSTLAKFPETKSFNSIDEAPDMAKPLYDFLNKEQQIDCLPKCCICGGDTVLIRGKYPSTPKRNVCAQCNTERLEQIQEISSPDYGRTCQNS